MIAPASRQNQRWSQRRDFTVNLQAVNGLHEISPTAFSTDCGAGVRQMR